MGMGKHSAKVTGPALLVSLDARKKYRDSPLRRRRRILLGKLVLHIVVHFFTAVDGLPHLFGILIAHQDSTDKK